MASDPFKNLTIRRKAGETVFTEGDLGSEMYVVQAGEVRLFRMRNGIKQELAILEKGDFFGELAVLEGLPRTSSAEALKDAELIEINSTTFDRMIRANIEIAVRMLRKLSNRLQEATHKLEAMSQAPAGRVAAEPVDLDRPPDSPPPAPIVEAPRAAAAPAAAPASARGAAPAAAGPAAVPDVAVPKGALGILVLEGGRIVEHGTHAQLIALGVRAHLGRVRRQLLANRAKDAAVFVHHHEPPLQRVDVAIEQVAEHA